jgi:hypothetical protein
MVDGSPRGGEIQADAPEPLPVVAEALTPPDREGTDWDALGASANDIRGFAVGGLSRRLKLIGVPWRASFK